MASKIRMEGFKWNWKQMKNKMRESLEISDEMGSATLYVQKGNPSKLDYGRFRPRLNRLYDTENVGDQQEEEEDHDNLEMGVEDMSDEQFNQYIDRINALRKGGGKGEKSKRKRKREGC